PSLSSSLLWSPDPRALHSFPTRRSSDLFPSSVFTPRAELFGLEPSVAASVAGWVIGVPLDSVHAGAAEPLGWCTDPSDERAHAVDRKSTRLNSSHVKISYAVFCLKKKKR